jgi:hypothetical protein
VAVGYQSGFKQFISYRDGWTPTISKYPPIYNRAWRNDDDARCTNRKRLSVSTVRVGRVAIHSTKSTGGGSGVDGPGSTVPVSVVDPFEAIVEWNGCSGLVEESIMSAVSSC